MRKTFIVQLEVNDEKYPAAAKMINVYFVRKAMFVHDVTSNINVIDTTVFIPKVNKDITDEADNTISDNKGEHA